ncbi:MAG TPA: RedB protein [Planctomycetota bacterium]|nr:RedB protein [Planctomycetota bacterium]
MISRLGWLGLGVLWLGAVCCGFTILHDYGNTPGLPASPPRCWPADAPQPRDTARPTLVLFVHPQCPCTAASIEELNRLLAHCEGRVRTIAFFSSDPALGDAWTHSANWSRASEIPGVTVCGDPLGATAALFGARTSGEVCLYSRDGVLQFEGGLTAGRGEAGDNPGLATLEALILAAAGGAGEAGLPRDTGHAEGGGSAGDAVVTAPVFGCSLAGCAGNPGRAERGP